MTAYPQVETLARRVPRLAAAQEIAVSFLAGGITNRNYRLDADGESFVLRVSGENTPLLGIDRAREAHNHCLAASAGIAPEAIGFILPEGYLLTRFVAGSQIPPEQLRRPANLRAVCRSLHAIHDGPAFLGDFSPFRTSESYLRLARERGAVLPSNLAFLDELARDIERALYAEAPLAPQPIHSDLLNENLLDDGAAIRILDWEYSGMGDVMFDLANLADHHRFPDEDERLLLQVYFGEFRERDHARLKLMRIMSNLREAMWGVVQRAVSTLDFDFAAYADEFLSQALDLAADARCPLWLRLSAGAD